MILWLYYLHHSYQRYLTKFQCVATVRIKTGRLSMTDYFSRPTIFVCNFYLISVALSDTFVSVGRQFDIKKLRAHTGLTTGYELRNYRMWIKLINAVFCFSNLIYNKNGFQISKERVRLYNLKWPFICAWKIHSLN